MSTHPRLLPRLDYHDNLSLYGMGGGHRPPPPQQHTSNLPPTQSTLAVTTCHVLRVRGLTMGACCGATTTPRLSGLITLTETVALPYDATTGQSRSGHSWNAITGLPLLRQTVAIPVCAEKSNRSWSPLPTLKMLRCFFP